MDEPRTGSRTQRGTPEFALRLLNVILSMVCARCKQTNVCRMETDVRLYPCGMKQLERAATGMKQLERAATGMKQLERAATGMKWLTRNLRQGLYALLKEIAPDDAERFRTQAYRVIEYEARWFRENHTTGLAWVMSRGLARILPKFIDELFA